MTALFLPTMVSEEETAMFVVTPREGGLRVPRMATTGLEPDLARTTPPWALHTGAAKVPVPVLSEHVALPRVPTYTVSASAAQ